MTGAGLIRVLADEGMPGAVVSALREEGFDVVWLAESNPGLLDDAVLQMADAERRILLTADKGFGGRVFGVDQPVSTGVILVRSRPRLMPDLVVQALRTNTTWEGYLVVIEPSRLRVTRFAPP